MSPQTSPQPARPTLDPRNLTMGDVRRAGEALKDHPVLKDEDGNPRDVGDLLNSGDWALVTTLCILCIRLRTDPTFTWEQAEDVPLGEFAPRRGAEPDPPTGPRGTRGPGARPRGSKGSGPPRPGPTPEPSSAASTT